MKLLTFGAGKIVEHLKDFHLSESGMLPVFDIKEVKPEAIDSEIAYYCALVASDPSATYHGFKAFVKQNPGAGLILFDAHAGHDSLKRLVDEKILDKNNIALVGTRSFDKEEKRFLEENNIKKYPMREISFEGLQEVADSVMSVAREWKKAYVSIQLDVLDPAFAPAVKDPQPGGLSVRELIYFIQRLKMLRNIGMADVVGLDLAKDANELTAKVAAKIVIELS